MTLLQRKLDADTAPSADGAADPEEAAVRRQRIERVLSRLTDGQRDVLLLRASEGLSGHEIAEALGITQNAVFTRLHRAHHVLDEILGEEAGR